MSSDRASNVLRSSAAFFLRWSRIPYVDFYLMGTAYSPYKDFCIAIAGQEELR
jgi:hypothetical protein